MGNGLYIYKWDDIYHMDIYLKKQLMSFIRELAYHEGITPCDKASQKHLKRLVDTCLLLDAYTREEGRLFFVSL